MNFRMQRFHSAAKHFRPAGKIGNIAHRHARFAQQFCRSARGQNLNLQRRQPLGKFHNPSFIENADQRAFHRHLALRKGKLSHSKRARTHGKTETTC